MDYVTIYKGLVMVDTINERKVTFTRLVELLWACNWEEPLVPTVSYKELINYEKDCEAENYIRGMGCPHCHVEETLKQARFIYDNIE